VSNRYLSVNGERVAAKIMDGEAILINLVTGMYYSMSGTGAFVWSLIERGASTGLIAERMTRSFEVELARATVDLAELVTALQDEGLVHTSAHGTDDIEGDVTEGTAAYVAPRLEKFTDMAEMFALDPPLPRLVER
jgi:hypothetical protein